MKTITRLSSIILVLVFGISACNLPSNATPTQGVNAALTFAAQTVAANMTQAAILNPPTIPPTNPAIIATSTLAIATTSVLPTSTLPPTQICDGAQFVTDVTIPDGTTLKPNETFTKTWRLKNTGTCSWTPSYAVVFSSGDSMSGPATQALTGNVNPGQTVDISVNLKAPGIDGNYKSNWKLRNASGVLFYGPFYADINVKAATPTPTATATATATPTTPPKADLIINLLELNPATPTQGNPVAVKVQVYNQGNAAAGAFKVAWWPGESYPNPACEWDIPSLVAIGGLVLNCNYAGYPSPYSSIITKASADTGGAISESNEGNNDAKLTISVN